MIITTIITFFVMMTNNQSSNRLIIHRCGKATQVASWWHICSYLVLRLIAWELTATVAPFTTDFAHLKLLQHCTMPCGRPQVLWTLYHDGFPQCRSALMQQGPFSWPRLQGPSGTLWYQNRATTRGRTRGNFLQSLLQPRHWEMMNGSWDNLFTSNQLLGCSMLKQDPPLV